MRRLILLLCVGFAWDPAAAVAGKKDKKPKHEAEASVEVHAGPVDVKFRFLGPEREHARTFFVEQHGRGKCPPGLAKKKNGCLPPGQARKRYLVGHPLPAAVVVLPLPPALEIRLGRPPVGFRYGIADGDLVKLEAATARVVDVIVGLVN